MKYLKLFEDIKDYYNQISYGEYLKLLKRRMPFNSKELSEIEEFRIFYRDKKIDTKYNIWIFKTEDEWYYTNLDGIDYYKCDQFEGLLKCLKDITKDI